MINPSTFGWIDKFFSKRITTATIALESDLYRNFRETGFIFGYIITIQSIDSKDTEGLTNDEIFKISFLDTLYQMYLYHNKNQTDSKIFFKKLVEFYEILLKKHENVFSRLITTSNQNKLEVIFNARIQTNKDVISQSFSHIVTNALLFIDVLAFEKYLQHGSIPEKYLKKVEELILATISLTLKTKPVKTKYDDLMIRLFEASVRFAKFSEVESNEGLENLNLDYFTSSIERFYLLDLANLSIWDDGILSNEEIYFIDKLAEKLKLPTNWSKESIQFVSSFITSYKKDIPYFNYSNPVKHFYDHTTSGVITLIKRNKSRLIKELSGSKELLSLIAKSAKTDLTKEEKKKVRKQLLDICKSIPSLTIFLLPGGGLLLPILVKFIPQLLPSAFNENLEDQ